MSIADIWSVMPLLILAAGALVVLLVGAVVPGRSGTATGIVTLLGAAVSSFRAPSGLTSSLFGVTVTPFGRFFTILFCLTGAIVLLLSHDYNKRRGIRGEEYAATLLFAVFGMTVLSTAGNLLTLFLGLE